jgi:hypothetical protein
MCKQPEITTDKQTNKKILSKKKQQTKNLTCHPHIAYNALGNTTSQFEICWYLFANVFPYASGTNGLFHFLLP